MRTSSSGSKPACRSRSSSSRSRRELPGSEAFIHAMSEAGKIVAIGHSAADVETVADGRARRRPHVDASRQRPAADPAETRQHAVRAAGGARPVCQFHRRRHPSSATGPASDDPRKGIERSILVTDAVSAAATQPGHLSTLPDMTIEHGSRRLRPRRPAAGLLPAPPSPWTGVRNIVDWGIADADRRARDGVRSSLDASSRPRLQRAFGVPYPIDGARCDWSDGSARLAVVGVGRHRASL